MKRIKINVAGVEKNSKKENTSLASKNVLDWPEQNFQIMRSFISKFNEILLQLTDFRVLCISKN